MTPRKFQNIGQDNNSLSLFPFSLRLPSPEKWPLPGEARARGPSRGFLFFPFLRATVAQMSFLRSPTTPMVSRSSCLSMREVITSAFSGRLFAAVPCTKGRRSRFEEPGSSIFHGHCSACRVRHPSFKRESAPRLSSPLSWPGASLRRGFPHIEFPIRSSRKVNAHNRPPSVRYFQETGCRVYL